MLDRMTTVLTSALRSDYPRLLTGEQYRERVAALLALAEGGKASPEYARELAGAHPADADRGAWPRSRSPWPACRTRIAS